MCTPGALRCRGMRSRRTSRSELGRGAGGLCDSAFGAQIEQQALTAHLSQLARFKVPHEIIFTKDLPRTALGKVEHFI